VAGKHFVVSSYMQYRSRTRDYDLSVVETIVRHSAERYFDTDTGRAVAVGSHAGRTVLIPYEETASEIRPVTVHATTRQQIRFRLRTGRFTYAQ
jgi:hypothetical protein